MVATGCGAVPGDEGVWNPTLDADVNPREEENTENQEPKDSEVREPEGEDSDPEALC
jgi:hypothetical protein